MPIALAQRLQRFALFGAGLVVLTAFDQWSKFFAVQRLRPGPLPTDGDLLSSAPHAVFSWWSMKLAGNKGAANSMFAGLPDAWRIPFLVGFTLVALGVLIWLFARSRDRWDAVALTCIAGGAIGNLVDRVRLGYVVDFISWRFGSWTMPTFNVADVAICAGVGLLFIAGIRRPDALLASAQVQPDLRLSLPGLAPASMHLSSPGIVPPPPEPPSPVNRNIETG